MTPMLELQLVDGYLGLMRKPLDGYCFVIVVVCTSTLKWKERIYRTDSYSQLDSLCKLPIYYLLPGMTQWKGGPVAKGAAFSEKHKVSGMALIQGWRPEGVFPVKMRVCEHALAAALDHPLTLCFAYGIESQSVLVKRNPDFPLCSTKAQWAVF